MIDKIPLEFFHKKEEEELVKKIEDKSSSECQQYELENWLHLAAENGYLKLLQGLLSKGLNINKQNNNTYTPLSLAAKYGHDQVVRMLMDNGAIWKTDNHVKLNSPFLNACIYGHEKVTHYFIDAGVNLKDPMPMMETSQLKELQPFLKHEVPIPNTKQIMPLFVAIDRGHAAIVKILLKNKVDANLIFYCKSNSISPLWLASSSGHEEIVSLLLQSGATVDFKNIHGITPLGIAASRGFESIVTILLKANADPNIIDDINGASPIYYACGKEFLGSTDNEYDSIVKHLIDAGANVNHTNDERNTPLSHAVFNGHIEIVKMLLSAGANLILRNGQGEPLLASPCFHQNYELVHYLILKGAPLLPMHGSSLLHCVLGNP